MIYQSEIWGKKFFDIQNLIFLKQVMFSESFWNFTYFVIIYKLSKKIIKIIKKNYIAKKFKGVKIFGHPSVKINVLDSGV